jgi:hypothetical protein
LKKALYDLKQAPRAWYEKMDGFLMSLGFNKSTVDSNLYYHIDGNECLILVLYVDDLFITGTERLIVECKQALTAKFEMKDVRIREKKQKVYLFQISEKLDQQDHSRS